MEKSDDAQPTSGTPAQSTSGSRPAASTATQPSSGSRPAAGATAARLTATPPEATTSSCGELCGLADFLAAQPAANSYTEEQKHGCLAAALRLPGPRLGDILRRLQQLAASSATSKVTTGTSGGKTPETLAALKALAVLLNVRASSAETLADALIWRLAKERSWRREQRLRALAVLLRSPSSSEDELGKLALRAPPSASAAMLCVLLDAEPGASLSEAQQNVVCRLGGGGSSRSSVPAVVETAGIDVLASMLRCEAVEAKILSRLASSGWGTEAQEAAKAAMRVAKGMGSTSEGHLDLTILKALQREPRDKQLVKLAALLSAEAPKEATLVRALSERSESLPIEVVRTTLRLVLDVAVPAPDAGSAQSGDACVEALARSIGTGVRDLLPTPELRLRAFACLLGSLPKFDAVLACLARSVSDGGLPRSLGRDVAEALLLGRPLPAQPGRPAPQAVLLGALQQRAQELSKATLGAVTDMLQTPSKGSSGSNGNGATSGGPGSSSPASTAQPASSTAAPASPAVGGSASSDVAHSSGRFGLGALELEPFDDEDDAGTENPTSTGAGGENGGSGSNGGTVGEPQESGWGALKALVEEEDDEDDDQEGEEEEEEDDGDEEVSDAEDLIDPAATKTRCNDEDAAEGDSEGELDEEADEADTGSAARSDFSDDLESYAGSELDPLDIADLDASDGESVEAQSDDGLDLGKGGLLTSMFGGGSLHSEDRARNRLRGELQLAPRMRHRPPSIRVVFPTLVWRGKDVLVVNKPADWICSASDVDKKRGRPLDPHEKVQSKGFKALDDLLQYQFGDREKKYIHWWIQLMHGLDRKSYPNLFDEDQNYGLCHRLDRETSGTVLVGLTQLARQQMRECFHRHYVRKLYVCLAHGHLNPLEQTVDRNLEAMGQKARLHQAGKRARTHVKVLAYYTKTQKNGRVDEFSLCTCEIAEGRMHQIRLHMSAALGAPIVSEFYYQKSRQMIEDRRWCCRTFLHAYAVGFPDVSGESRRIGCSGTPGDCGLVEEARRDTEQEWHCCICPLTVELRQALQDLTPKDETAESLLKTIAETGLLDTSHEAVHVMGTEGRNGDIDCSFFPWSSSVNPIEVGDLAKPREVAQRQRCEGNGNGGCNGKGAGRFRGEGAALRPKAKPRRCNHEQRPRPLRGCSASPRRHERLRGVGGAPGGFKRMRLRGGRPRSPGLPPPPPRSRSPARRCRSRSCGRPLRGGCRRSLSPRRRPPGAPPSPRRSPSGPLPPRRKRRWPPSPGSASPHRNLSRPPPPRRLGGKGAVEAGLGGSGVPPPPPRGSSNIPGGRRAGESPQRVVLTACR
mmetsp:Transcript_88819/g.176574  ORF Transcript_88819/g.176574 Transcript_88819/m.176574 type:complete len:1317 (+) Transcript_88819:113-4063(+)